MLAPFAVQRTEQRQQHGAGGVVLIAHPPRGVRPAQHTAVCAVVDLHHVIDKVLQQPRFFQAVGVVCGQRMEKVRHGRLARAVGAHGLCRFLPAVGVNFGGQPLPHAGIAALKQHIGLFKPFDARARAVPQGGSWLQTVAGLHFRQRQRRARQPVHHTLHDLPPAGLRGEPRPQKIAQAEAADHHLRRFQPEGVLGKVLPFRVGHVLGRVVGHAAFVDQQRAGIAGVVVRRRAAVALVVQQGALRQTGEIGGYAFQPQKPRGVGGLGVVQRKALQGFRRQGIWALPFPGNSRHNQVRFQRPAASIAVELHKQR